MVVRYGYAKMKIVTITLYIIIYTADDTFGRDLKNTFFLVNNR